MSVSGKRLLYQRGALESCWTIRHAIGVSMLSSRRSRKKLLCNGVGEVERVVHGSGWVMVLRGWCRNDAGGVHEGSMVGG